MRRNYSKPNTLQHKMDEMIFDMKMTAKKFERDSIKAEKVKN